MIFLLGGYDLEMIEIRNLLQKKGVKYFDKQLNWGNASLSQYTDMLSRYSGKDGIRIYGIELSETGITNIPSNYFRIDHHNDFNKKKSSLEQVAEILRTPLTHYQQLVSANDSGYIPAMQEVGATPEEIELIRKRDREAQGVSKEDEQLAEKAISEKKAIGDIIVIKAYSPRFSPVCDRLYPYKNLIIYTDNELVYYGNNKELLTKIFTKELEENKMFHGGGDNGYFGTIMGIFSPEEIEELKHKIATIVEPINQ